MPSPHIDMGLFEIDRERNTAKRIPETEFASHKIYERYNIQEWIADMPEILGEELLIVAKEFSAFDKTNERADLIALDKKGNVVIIELKRDDTGADVHWQAVKYASYFRKVDFENIVKIYSAEHDDCEFDASKRAIFSFVDVKNPEEINQEQRIILASHRFALEVTSAVLWLNEKGLDITCVKIVPHTIDGKLVIQTNKIIPVLGTENYEITAVVGEKEVTISRGENRSKSDDISIALRDIYDRACQLIGPSGVVPTRVSRWAGTYYDLRYFKIWFDDPQWDNHNCSFQLHVHTSNPDSKFVSARFHLNKDWIGEVGFTENMVKKLREGLTSMKGIEQDVLDDQNDKIDFVRFFDKKVLVERDEVASFLKDLIVKIYPILSGT